VDGVQLAELTDDGTVHVVVNRYNPIQGLLVSSLILTTKDKKPVAYEVLIGFQLSRDELAYNRERHRYMP